MTPTVTVRVRLASPTIRMDAAWPPASGLPTVGDVLKMTDQSSRPAGGGLALLRAPVSGWAWRATIHVMTGFPIGIVTFVVTLVLVALTGGLLITAVLAVATLALLIWCTRGFTAMQRSRFRAVLGVQIAPVPRQYGGTWLRRLLAEARAGSTWRQVTYHLLALVIGTLGSSY